MTSLYSPYSIGPITLANRLVMAPMSRSRASIDGVPGALMIEHYQQRATAGLIISESAPVSQQGVGYPNTPGLFSPEQTAGWLRVVNAVHSHGGRIFAQLQHCGRISHRLHQEDNRQPVAPSAIKPDGFAVTAEGYLALEEPKALDAAGIADVVNQYRLAAQNALNAGFDGIEVHGANGYLIDQFLRDGTNQRADEYGGSLENRVRLLQDVLDAVTSIYPADRVGLRLSPENSFNDMTDSDPQRHFEGIIEAIAGRGLGYLHMLESSMDIGGHIAGSPKTVDYTALRSRFPGVYIANNGYDKSRAELAIQSGYADLVSFGAPFIANPDLVKRYRENLPLNNIDKSTFYGGDETGYNDYPFASINLEGAA